MRVLVTGGAGFIGSVIVRLLLDQGHDVLIYDDLSTGHLESIPSQASHIRASLLDQDALEQAVEGAHAVIHCAGKSLVSESVANPEKYHNNNVVGSGNLFDAMALHGVKRLVFSSSAAVYKSNDEALAEDSAEEPSNPYGESKLAVDRMIVKHEFIGASFRYFNVAGALFHEGRWYGERHLPETHLIPNLLSATTRRPLPVYGNDWPTPDGTCIRDYIHVWDLARAHVIALHNKVFDICNLGTGIGSSVLEVIKTAEESLARRIPHQIQPRRAGDPAVLVAAYAKAEKVFGWKPTKGLAEMIGDAESFRSRPW